MGNAQLGGRPDAVLIAGPTASGKSTFAIEQAEKWDGVIVNADSMQVYPVLRILTARPGDEDLARVPHRLYGHASLQQVYSVALWLDDVRKVLAEIAQQDKIPVFVGGTGLYFKALIEGLAIIPEIPAEIRSRLRFKLDQEGIESIRVELLQCDPQVAETLKPGDRQRNLRALEVFKATGRSILSYQNAANSVPVVELKNTRKFVLLPDRNLLHKRIEKRFDMMLGSGAIDEVMKLSGMRVAADHPVQKAIGFNQLGRYLAGELSAETAANLSVIATRQYAKRQSTWFRNQLDEDWVAYR